MAHKVHPKIFRIKEITDWDSRWLSKKNFPQLLEEDFKIKEFLKKRLAQASLGKIEIERFPGKINIILQTARPGLIIGRGGEGVEELKRTLEQKILTPAKKSIKRQEIKIEIKEIRDPWLRASLVSQLIAQQLEKRVFHRRVLKQTIEKVMAHKEAKGVRVEVAGRLGGSEIARREWLKKGRLPRHTLRADIDYATCEAFCTYGVIGIKVWIYKGEKF
ncbi:MAG: 30S ribosomal protein S3 [Candidatus Nealsonbacteria bacterium RBG_13_36_15]|uniref:Small ribosomal subunit protein uS3 n=1 Tax=Candidatus Nealsonbacteria bacterium RBG_13_36_15 TaxID=1801660 RepID=A0A1G2DVU9_9BACT|nr:MAG: 30S ribosomal protein S3 [Candidatus Nealsonbacteria bacterium RBG_13_36_15]